MAGKKGIIPTHVKKKNFSHPNIQHPITRILEEIEDFRKPSYFFQYSLINCLPFWIIFRQHKPATATAKNIKKRINTLRRVSSRIDYGVFLGLGISLSSVRTHTENSLQIFIHILS